eukprot:s391_g6.t1
MALGLLQEWRLWHPVWTRRSFLAACACKSPRYRHVAMLPEFNHGTCRGRRHAAHFHPLRRSTYNLSSVGLRGAAGVQRLALARAR